MKNELNFHPNFERLVLGCIHADFCNQIVILQHFSRSTRSAHVCTTRNSSFWRKLFKFPEKIQNFRNFWKLKITLMLPSQKIEFWMENRKTFLSQNKIAHLPTPLPQWVLLFENNHFIQGRPPKISFENLWLSVLQWWNLRVWCDWRRFESQRGVQFQQ